MKVREGRIGEVTEILAWYEFINDIILDHLDDEIKSTDQSGVWRYLISFKVRMAVMNEIFDGYLQKTFHSSRPFLLDFIQGKNGRDE